MKDKKSNSKFKFIFIDLAFLALFFLIMSISVRYFDIFADRGLSRENFYFGLVLWGLFLGLLLIRCFNRPDYDLVLAQYKKGWKISGYYSKFSLGSRVRFEKAYGYWIRTSLIITGLEGLAYVIYSGPKSFLISRDAMISHFSILMLGLILAWVLTKYRERQF